METALDTIFYSMEMWNEISHKKIATLS